MKCQIPAEKNDRHLAKLHHVQSAVFHVGVVFANQLADFMPWQLDVDNFQSFLQFHHRNEAIAVSINLTQSDAVLYFYDHFRKTVFNVTCSLFQTDSMDSLVCLLLSISVFYFFFFHYIAVASMW